VKTAFAVTAPGVEALTASELRALGLTVEHTEPGGVTFQADASGLYVANLHLRTATRVLVRVAEFVARDFRTLEKHAARIPWDAFTPPGGVVGFRVTSKKSKLYHQRAVAERLSEAARRAGRAALADVADQPSSPDEAGSEAQRLVVRIFRDRCTVSVDASGDNLHRRGYRLATAKAPLRENLAAAVLMATGWDGSQPLVDPMCGSGTLLIEGALLARRIPPGLGRDFAFKRWPGFDERTWLGVVQQARDPIIERAPVPIAGSDRDQGAVDAAARNAERAGVAGDLQLAVRALSEAAPPDGAGPGWLVTNPPYGRRIGNRDALRNLYAALGNVARKRFAGWTLAVVAADPALVGQIGLPLQPALTTRHGGVPIQVWSGAVPGP